MIGTPNLKKKINSHFFFFFLHTKIISKQKDTNYFISHSIEVLLPCKFTLDPFAI